MKTTIVLFISFVIVLLSCDFVAGSQEGKLIWYTSIPIHASRALAKEFEKRHKNIRLEVINFEAIGEELLNSMFRGKKPIPDVFDSNRIDILRILTREGLLLKYEFPENLDYPRFITDEAYLGYLSAIPVIIAYNKDAVDYPHVPKSWHDLLAPRWEGDIGLIDVKGDKIVNRALRFFWNEKLGKDFLPRLQKLDPMDFKVSEAVANALMIRDAMVGTITLDRFSEFTPEKRYPIDYLWPKEGTVLVPTFITIPSSAKNQSGAKTFIRYILSKEGQHLYQKILANTISLRKDLKPLGGFKQKIDEGYQAFLYKVADEREFLIPYSVLK